MKCVSRAIVGLTLLFLYLFEVAGSAHAQTATPPLHFSQILQAPSGTSTTRAALNGRTIVLEFWATWCVPCVASIPQWNALVKATNSDKVVFISVADEDAATIASFAKRRAISGWLGIDSEDALFKSFGVSDRPTTIVLDGRGRVVERTHVDKLIPAELEKFSGVQSHQQKARCDGAAQKSAPPDAGAKPKVADTYVAPLLSISVKPDSDKQASVLHGPDIEGVSGWTSAKLWTKWIGIPSRRFDFEHPLPEGTYTFYVNYPHPSEGLRSAAIRSALLAAFGRSLAPEQRLEEVIVLDTREGSRGALVETGSLMTPQFAAISNGRLQAVSSSMGQIAGALEEGLDVVVVDETRLDGKYDVSTPITGETVDEKIASIAANLGLKATLEKRTVTYYKVLSVTDSQ